MLMSPAYIHGCRHLGCWGKLCSALQLLLKPGINMQGLTAGPVSSVQKEQHSNIYQGALKLPQLEEHLRETIRGCMWQMSTPAAPQPVCRRHL